MPSTTIFLTGFTGILGKRFAYCLAKEGYQVICPIRAGSEAEARSRFEKVFHGLSDLMPEFDASVEKRIRAIPGDVRSKGLGIPPFMLGDLERANLSAVWHLAALLDLTETKSQDVYETNFLGTLNVLEFAKRQRIPEMHYFSTFGSSGKLHEGIVREIPGIRPPAFRNTYERTKWEAERHVWQAQIRNEISVTIYRPSIVVGDSVFGRYEQFNVFNHPYDVVSRVRTKLCEKAGIDPKTDILKYDLRIPGNENATLNIVPLDFVLDTVMKIYAAPRSRGRVYHIVNPNPPSLKLSMEIFKRDQPWDGLRWESFDPAKGFLNPFEKFIVKQLGFLAPYLQGEGIYDYSNVQTVLAFEGGLPPIHNDIFLGAISRRGLKHGWQEVKSEAALGGMGEKREQLDAKFAWPEGSGLVVDFSPYHPTGSMGIQGDGYSVTEKLLGKAYQVREKLFAKRGECKYAASDGRDIVLVPFGMGVSRRGVGETSCYRYNETLADEVFARMNQVVGFDLRAYAREKILGHEDMGDLHDKCCWAVGDDLVHVVRLFRELQAAGATGLVSRLQLLPHSAGTYLCGWLAGVLSFQDALQVVHQAAKLMAEAEVRASQEEVHRWYFNPKEKLSEAERKWLSQIRERIDPQAQMGAERLAEHLHGSLELVFSLNAHFLNQLVSDIRENRIGVSLAISMSPNSAVFAGNALEMERFRKLFVGKRKIELRQVPVEVSGTPHHERLKEANRHTTELLKMYDFQGRLRDPVVPLISFDGELVRTRAEFIRAVAGIPSEPCSFDRMIERTLEEGGRHFVMIQSGLSTTAGDLFEGIIRNRANTGGFAPVHVYRPSLRGVPHPLCSVLESIKENRVAEANRQSLSETLAWYEKQLVEDCKIE